MEKKRFLATTLSAVMMVGSMGMVACAPDDGETSGPDYKYNIWSPEKMEIKVENFGLGPGNDWLYETVDRFAQAQMDVKYGNKTGVYIDVQPNHQQETSQMNTDSTNIYFDERNSDPKSLINSKYLLNLDSIVKDTTRVGGSLDSKIFPSVKGGITDENGSYYALPHYEFYPGIVFNRGTFDELGAYFAAEDEDNVYPYDSEKGYGSANFVGDLEAERSPGPDGQPDTDDDGLPRSLEEFILLCDFISYESDGEIAPITVSGKYYNYYPEYLLLGLWSSLAGAEQMRNYYNCSGEIEVVERDADGNLLFEEENLFRGVSYIKKPKTKIVQMTAADGADGWLGNDMVAKYYAISMLDIIAKEGFFSATAGSGKDHWQTQKDLFMEGKLNTNQSAMLVEGSYWYNEAGDVGSFDDYEDEIGSPRNDMPVEWMSLPTSVKTADAVGKPATYLDCGIAYALVNGNIAGNEPLKQACLDFVAFCYSEQELKNFTMKTGIARSIAYELGTTELAGLSYYARSLWTQRDNVNGSNVVSWSGTTGGFTNYRGALQLDLDCGAFLCGAGSKVAHYLASNSAAQAFAACSQYGKWSKKAD